MAKKILVISPTPTHPQDAGNRARIYALLSNLKKAGHLIYFAFVEMESADYAAMEMAWDGLYTIPYKPRPISWIRRIGLDGMIPYRIDDRYNKDISIHLNKINDELKPDMVIVEYVFLSKAFESFSQKVVKILDTHDIFGNRHRLFKRNDMMPQWFYTTVDQERKGLNRADIVVAIQEKEANYFSKQTSRKVITVGHLVKSHDKIRSVDNNNRLLFVGSANKINVRCIQCFIDEVFPMIREEFSDAEIEVVGRCADEISPDDGVILTGHVKSLISSYRGAKAVINPVKFGTGLKIKSIEALAMGRPLVTTRAGAVGLEAWAGKAYLIADSPYEFVNAVRAIFSSEKLRTKIIENALECARNYNKIATDILNDLVEKI